MPRTKILYVGNFGLPEESAAGKRVYANALLFRSLGYEMCLVGKSKALPPCASKAIGDGLTFDQWPSYGYGRARKYLCWLDENHLGDASGLRCIIRYGSPTTASFDRLLSRDAKSKHVPLVADVVDWLNADGSNPLFNAVKTLDTYLEKAVYNKRADGHIVIGSYLASFYGQCSPVAPLVLPPLTASVPGEASAANEAPVFAYAGSPFRRGHAVKNPAKVKDRLDVVVEAFCNLGSAHLDVYGLTRGEYLTAFPSHSSLLAEPCPVAFHGQTPMDECQTAIRAADFTVLCRDRNRATEAGFPTKVTESVSLGTPVLLTDTGDLSRYLRDGETCIFAASSSVDSFVEGLRRACALSREERQRMKDACASDESFLFSNYASKAEEFLHTLNPSRSAN